MSKQPREKRPEQQLNDEAERLEQQAQKQQMRHIKHKHPDCIPIYFVKHKQASKSLPQPTTNFILFQKDLKIQQPMYRLYEQIKTKGLHFFCLHSEKEKAKYVKLKPGPTIEQIYNKYGRNEYLILIYADSELGMEGIKKMERCLMWILGILATIWIVLFGLNYFLGWKIGSTQTAQVPGTKVVENELMQDIN